MYPWPMTTCISLTEATHCPWPLGNRTAVEWAPKSVNKVSMRWGVVRGRVCNQVLNWYYAEVNDSDRKARYRYRYGYSLAVCLSVPPFDELLCLK